MSILFAPRVQREHGANCFLSFPSCGSHASTVSVRWRHSSRRSRGGGGSGARTLSRTRTRWKYLARKHSRAGAISASRVTVARSDGL